MSPNATANPSSPSPSGGDDGALVARLEQLKRAFDSGLITQAEYDASRSKALGL